MSRDAKIGLIAAILIAVAAASGAPWWARWASGSHSKPVGASSFPASPVIGMSGGCPAFQVFAQGRWKPLGTAIRAAPNVLSAQEGSFPANMSIAVNGWVHGRPAYPTNTAPWNSDVWFHPADGAGWSPSQAPAPTRWHTTPPVSETGALPPRLRRSAKVPFSKGEALPPTAQPNGTLRSFNRCARDRLG
jgi:hypothetical protein